MVGEEGSGHHTVARSGPVFVPGSSAGEMQGEETGHAITRTDTTSLTVTGGVAMVPCRSTSGGNPPCAAGNFRSQRAFARADPTAAERKQACASTAALQVSFGFRPVFAHSKRKVSVLYGQTVLGFGK